MDTNINNLIGPLIIGLVCCAMGIPVTLKFIKGYGLRAVRGGFQWKLIPHNEARLFDRTNVLIFGPLLLILGAIALVTFFWNLFLFFY